MVVRHLLKEQLEGSGMPLIPHSDQGLAWKIHERLWKFAKGKLSESEFEEFLTDKLEAAEKNLETLETNLST